MKFSKSFRYWFGAFGVLIVLVLILLKSFLGTSTCFPVSDYYGYDKAIPLQDSVSIAVDTTDFRLFKVSYTSVHNQRVTALLSIPKNQPEPVPIVILMHGLGDRKTVDYVEYGNRLLLENGFAVLRLDISDHGDRKKEFYDFDLTGPNKYWTRNIVTQTVFDLRRAVDFIETRPELDSKRIGYYGISLGGIIGTVFCGVEERIKVPVVALAGGQLNLLYKQDGISDDAKNFLSIIEPLNFVTNISPRPFLMLNAKNDEIVPPMMSKLLFKKANEPKEIIWYDAKHRNAPLDIIYKDGLNWFKKYL